MFNSLRVSVGEDIVHSLKRFNALIEIKLHGTQSLSSVHWEIICKPQFYVLLLILIDEPLYSPQNHFPDVFPLPSAVGELKMMFFPIKMAHLEHPGLQSFSIQDSHHCR